MKNTKKMMIGVIAGLTTVGMTGCASEPLPPEPTGTDCTDWDWNYDLGVYECDDDYSRSYGGYYYGGTTHHSVSSLQNNSSYKSYKSSSSFKGSSGFGSGKSSSFGG